VHIPDGVLDPVTCLGTAALSAGAVGLALRRVRRDLPERVVPLMGVVAACVFAAQMLNFPIPGGTSGHILGSVLAAVLLGPWAGVLVMAVVLSVQCVLFQDGGLTALGANVLNVAVAGPLAGYAIYDLLRRQVGGLRGTIAGAVIAAWFVTLAAATLCAIELSLSGRFPLMPTLGVMLLVHSVIGIGEALVTGLALGFVLRVRPDLVYGRPAHRATAMRAGQLLVGGLSIALVMAAVLSPFASTLPDGLESAMARLGFESQNAAPMGAAPFADYHVAALASLGVAGSAAGVFGTLVVFIIALVLAWRWPSRTAPSHL
jgi:cobalt/nickel transport system permease protein